jgi:hypothetical protein
VNYGLQQGWLEERFEKRPCIPSGSTVDVHVYVGSGIVLHCTGDDSLKKTPEAAHQMGVENFIGEQVLTNGRSSKCAGRFTGRTRFRKLSMASLGVH